MRIEIKDRQGAMSQRRVMSDEWKERRVAIGNGLWVRNVVWGFSPESFE